MNLSRLIFAINCKMRNVNEYIELYKTLSASEWLVAIVC